MSELKTGAAFKHQYVFEARDKDDNLLWEETVFNLTVNEGLNDILNRYWKGSSYTAAHYIGLTGNSPTVAAADTLASHAGWTEVTAYSESNRQALTLGTVAAQSVNNSASKATFTINDDGVDIGGAFVATNNTKGGTTGVLVGGAALSANRTLNTGDTLTITVTATAASA
jgi:hypothetical protein